ncbi:MAG: tol-pal system protein YbgF [Sedimentitalea sp.]
MRMAAVALMALMGFGGPTWAQDSQTLADIRQELTVLYVEVQRLNRELSTTGAPTVNLSGTGVLDRVGAIEAELQRLTAQTEQLDFRVTQIVRDGTNRIGDLEFRLVELEGGDVSQLGETSTLGGAQAAAAPAPAETGTELAVGERSDYDLAQAALSEGAYAKAATLFADFNTSYPGSPLAPQAELNRGKALDNLGDTREAARAYLASFTANAPGPTAPAALFELGSALGRLQQVSQACVTLGEVGARFPSAQAAGAARTEMAKLGCS